MSRTIDEKVVEMRFDNSDFEKNVSQSMSTLDKLKSALDFSGASKAFEGINSAVNKVSFGGLTSAIDGVGEKFSALETIATGALLNIGRKVEDFVSNQIKSVTLEPITEGFGKYASKTSSVQMIMNAIRDGTKSDAELMEEVNGQLERLMWYTDETSYDFAEMTASIGKFTSAGIGLEEAVTAMEGIANLAGISGATKAEANRAMYNISQALSGGFMRLQDWKSIENANMATKEFKEMLIKAAIDRGTLEQAIDEAGNIIWGVSTSTGFNEVNYKTVASTLTEGKWLTNEVLTDTLAMYGAFTDELSKVYDDINENADVTTSQIIKMTNQWKDGTLDMNEAIAMTGKSAEELEAIFASLGRDEYDLGRRAFAAAQEAKTFQEAIDATKDAVSTGWMKTFELLFGNYEEAKVLWTDLANELWEIFAGPISDINDVLTAWRNNDDLGDGREDLIEGLKNIYRAARSVVNPITEAWEAIFPPATYKDVWNFTHRFKEFTDGLILSENTMKQVSMVFEDFFGIFKTFGSAFKDGGGFGKFFEGIGGILKNGTDRVYDFILGIQRIRSAMEAFENGDLSEFSFVQQTIDAYPAAAKFLDIYEKITKTAETLGRTFGKLFDYTTFLKDGALTLDSIISGIELRIATILGSASEIIHLWTGIDIGKTAGDIRAILFGVLDGLRDFLMSERWSEVKYAITGIATAFKDTFGPAWHAAVAIFSDWIAGIRSLIEGADGDFSGFFDTVTRGAYHIASFIRSLKGGVEFISDFLVRFLSLTDAINTYRENGGGIVGLLSVVHEKLKIVLDTIFDIVQKVTGLDIHGVGDGIISVIESVERAVLQVADTIAKAFGWNNNPFGKLLGVLDEGFGGLEGNGFDLSGIFGRFGDAFSRLGELVNKVAPGVSVLLRTVGDAFKNLWELIGQIRLEDLIMIFQGIASIALMFQAKNTLAELGDTLEAYQKKLKADMLFAIAGSILMIAGAALMISKIDADKIGLVLGTLGTAFVGLIGMMVASKWADPKALAALPGTVLAIATSMAILAKAAEIMTGPIQAFADMENFWGGMGKLGTVMGSFLAMLGILGALNQSGAVLGASKALGKLAGVLAVMLPIVFAYSKIDWPTFGNGLIKAASGIAAVGAALGLLVLFEKKLTEGGYTADFMSMARSLLVLSGAIAVLTVVMLALTKLDAGNYFASLGKMLGIFAVAAGGVWLFSKALTAFGETMFLLDKTGAMKALDRFSTVLVKLGTAILMLTVGTLGLGLIAKLLGDSAQEIAEAGVNLIVVVLDAIVARTPEIAEDIVLFILGVLDAVADHTPEIVSACIRIIGGIAEGVKDAMENGGIDLGEILGGGGILAGILGITWLLKNAKLGVKDFIHAGGALAGAAVLLTEIGAIFWALGTLSAKVGGAEGIRQFGEFCSAIVSVFTEDWGVIALFAAVAGLLVVFDKLKLGAAGGGALGKLIVAIAEVAGVVEAVGLVFAAFGAIINLLEKIPGGGEGAVVDRINKFGELAGAVVGVISNVIGQLVGGIAGGVVESVMKGYANGLAYIEETANEFFTLMDSLKPGTLEGCKLFAEMITELTKADIIDSLWIFNGKVNYKEFGDGLADLAPGIKAFAEQTKDLDQGAVEKAAACAQIITAFAKDIPNSGGIISWFTGNNDIDDFAAGVKKLAPALAEFSTYAKGIDEDAVAKAGACADIIIAFAKEIPNEGGLLGWIVGNNDMAAFAEKLPLFAQGLVDFSNIVGGVGNRLKNQPLELPKLNSEAVASSSEAVNAIIEMAKSVPTENAGWKWFTEGNNSIANFGTNLEKFGTSLVTYSQTLSSDDFKLIVIKNTNSAIESIVGMAQTIGEKGFPDITDFGGKLKSFGSSFADYYNNVKDIDSAKVDGLSGSINRMVKSFIGTDDTSLSGQIITLTTDFLDKLAKAFGGDTSKKKSEESADKFIDYFRDRFEADSSINKISIAVTTMMENAVGKDELKEGLKQSGLDLIGEFQNGIAEAFESEGGLNTKFASFLEALATSIATDGQGGSKKKYYDAGAALTGALRNGMVNEEATSGFGVPPAKQLKDDFKSLLDSLIGLIVSEETKSQFQRGGASLINAMLGGIKSVDVSAEMTNVGKNATLGVANGMADQAAIAQVKKNAAYVMNTATSTMKAEAQEKSPSKLTALYGWYLDGGLADGLENGIPMVVTAVGTVVDETKDAFTKSAEQGGFDIHSNSWLTTLFGRFLDGGLADGLLDGIPGVRDAVAKVKQAVTSEMGINDLMSLLKDNGLDVDGTLENEFASFIEKYGASFDTGGEEWSENLTESFSSGLTGYASSGSAANAMTMVTEDMSDVFEGYQYTIESYGDEAGAGYANHMADSMTSTMENIAPKLATDSEMLADAAATPIEERMTEMLSYVEWVAKEYPKGISEAFSSPVFDFTDLYSNMQGGQLEALLNEFDALDEAGRKNLIRSYGLGENGGNEDLANYLQWYWKNEPIRLQNEEAMARAQEGYQVYLEEQKALQEAQAVQSQQQYEGVQQIAADMQTHTDEFNAKYLAVVEEIKMNVIALREELDGVQETLGELNNMDVYIDSNALVGATAEKYNEELGNLAKIGRRNVTR